MITDKETIQKKMEAAHAFILDMDGTIYLGKNLFLHTYDSLSMVKVIEREYYFFTSNSSRDLAAYIDKPYGMGIDIGRKQIMASAHVILHWLGKHRDGRRVYAVGIPTLRREFGAHGQTLDKREPDTVILGFDTTLTYEKLSKTCILIRKSILYYGINPDLNCLMEHDTSIPDCGSTAELIEASTGKHPESFGRLSGKTLDYIVEKTGCSSDQIVVIGDRLYTDIKVADSSEVINIPVLSEETKAEGVGTSDVKPDIVVEHIGELAKLLQEYPKK